MKLQELKLVYPISRATIKSLKHISTKVDEEMVKQYYRDMFSLLSSAYIFLNTARCSEKELSARYELSYGSLIQRRGRTVYELYMTIILCNKEWYPKELEILRKYDIQMASMLWVVTKYCSLTEQTLKTMTVNNISDDLLFLLVKQFKQTNSNA